MANEKELSTSGLNTRICKRSALILEINNTTIKKKKLVFHKYLKMVDISP